MNKTFRKKGFLLASSLIVGSLVLSGCASSDSPSGDGETLKIRLSDSNMDGEIGPVAFDEWGEAVEEASDGSITVDVFHASQLVKGPDLVAAMNDGRAEAGYLIADFNPEAFPMWGGASLPFVTSDPYAQADAFQYMYDNNDEFRGEFNDAGVHILSFFPVQPGLLALGKDVKVDSLDSLKGMSLRAFGWWGKAIEKVGAVPVFLSTDELVESLERGVIEGVVGQSIDPLVDRGMHEMAPNLVHTGMGMYVGTAFGISNDLWESLTDEQRDVLTAASADINDAYKRQYDDLADDYCSEVSDSGGKVSLLSKSDQESFKDQVKDQLHSEWRDGVIAAGHSAEAVDEFWDTYTQKIAEFEEENDYTDIATNCAK